MEHTITYHTEYTSVNGEHFVCIQHKKQNRAEDALCFAMIRFTRDELTEFMGVSQAAVFKWETINSVMAASAFVAEKENMH